MLGSFASGIGSFAAAALAIAAAVAIAAGAALGPADSCWPLEHAETANAAAMSAAERTVNVFTLASPLWR